MRFAGINPSKGKTFDVVGLGRAYVDVVARVTPEFLESHGIPYDSGRMFPAENLAAIKQELSSPLLSPGGSVANTLCGISSLGGRTGFLGKVATDDAGKLAISSLEERGVKIACNAFCEEAASSALCLVLTSEDGSRSLAYNRGCSDNFSVVDFYAFDFGSTAFFLIEAHFLTDSLCYAVVEQAIAKAKKADCCMVMSLSDISSWREYLGGAQTVVNNADIIVGNDREFEAFRSVMKPKPDQIEIITKGELGALARQGRKEVCVDAIKPKRFENSAGAGDQFLAGLLMGLSFGQDVEASMSLAARCAAEAIEEVGARPQLKGKITEFAE